MNFGLACVKLTDQYGLCVKLSCQENMKQKHVLSVYFERLLCVFIGFWLEQKVEEKMHIHFDDVKNFSWEKLENSFGKLRMKFKTRSMLLWLLIHVFVFGSIHEQQQRQMATKIEFFFVQIFGYSPKSSLEKV